MPRSEQDRKLEEYLRQLKTPEVMAKEAPFMTDASDPYAAHRTDAEIKNLLGKRVGEPKSPMSWQRDAERLASSAVAKDYYKTRDFSELLDKLNQEAGLKLDVKLDPNLEGSGQTVGNKIKIRPESKYDDIDTLIHEFGHQQDYAKDPYKSAKLNLDEDNAMKVDPLGQRTAMISKNLPGVESRISANHFLRPGSHSLNTFIDKLRDIAAQQGLTDKGIPPDKNEKFNELNPIKETVKSLSGYNPNPQEPSMFEKIKSMLGNN